VGVFAVVVVVALGGGGAVAVVVAVAGAVAGGVEMTATIMRRGMIELWVKLLL